jgi:hypothetical protein
MNKVWRDSHSRLDTVHRVGAILFGLGLWVFGILGLVNRLDPFSLTGAPVLGLSSNGLLSVISLVVGGILIAAAVRGGRTASTVTVTVGTLFVLSGLLNVLAFRMSNVIFSLVAGALLLFLGAYGRFTGGLPEDNQYRAERHGTHDAEDVPLPTVFRDAEDVIAARELAEAERAVAQHAASPAQADGVAAAMKSRRAEDRVQAWRASSR